MVGAHPGLDADSRRIDRSAHPVFSEIAVVNAKANRYRVGTTILFLLIVAAVYFTSILKVKPSNESVARACISKEGAAINS
jgi:hypothetical protein